MRLAPFEYIECHSIDEATDALSAHGDEARIIAGGTVVVPLMKHGLLRPTVVVSIDRIPSLADVVDQGHCVQVGPLVTHHNAARSQLIQERAPLFAQACGRVASPVIRSMGTIGGNLCYGESASDPAPALLALGARVLVHGPGGARVVPIEEFFVGFYETALGTNELVTGIEIPKVPAGTRWTYVKWTPRAREDKPLIGLAALLVPNNGSAQTVRLAVGGVDPRPRLLEQASSLLSDAALSDRDIAAAAEAAAAEVDPMTDLQGSAEYRREMLAVWVRRALHHLRAEQNGGQR